MIAGCLMIWGSIICICRHHHIFITHEVNIERHINGKLQDVEDEDIGSIHRAGKAADVSVIHLP